MLNQISYDNEDLLRFEAIISLEPKAKFRIPNGGDIDWLSEDITQPTEESIQTEIANLKAEYEVHEYARNRASAYDSVGDQLDMMMKDMRDGTTTHQTACEAVKAKYPKPE